LRGRARAAEIVVEERADELAQGHPARSRAMGGLRLEIRREHDRGSFHGGRSLYGGYVMADRPDAQGIQSSLARPGDAIGGAAVALQAGATRVATVHVVHRAV